MRNARRFLLSLLLAAALALCGAALAEGTLMRDASGPEQLASGVAYAFGNASIPRDSVRSVTVVNHANVPGDAEQSWDVSAAGDGSVLAWVVRTDGDMFDLCIGSEGAVRANGNCDGLFAGYTRCEAFSFGNCFDTSDMRTARNMFFGCESVRELDLSGFNAASLESANSMFEGCRALTRVDLSGFGGGVAAMDRMFCDTPALAEIVAPEGFAIPEGASEVFEGSALSGLNRPQSASEVDVYALQAQIDALQAQIDAMKSGAGLPADSGGPEAEGAPEREAPASGAGGTLMCAEDSYIFRLDDPSGGHVPGNPSLARSGFVRIEFRDSLAGAGPDAWDMSEARDGSVLGWTESASGGPALVIAADGPVRANADSSYLFGSYTGVREIDFNGCFDCSGANKMRGMFNGCTSLESLDLAQLDTSNVTNMSGMFWSCETLHTLDLSSLNTSKVENMSNMFYHCSRLEELYPTELDTSAATNMGSMFGECNSLVTIDLQGLDTSRVTDMSDMFFSCDSLQSIFMAGLNTSRVETMRCMFVFCYDLRLLDVSGFDTSNVTDMSSMFQGDRMIQELRLESFDFGRVTDASEMFKDCAALRDIWMGDDFILDIDCDAEDIFENCDAAVHSPYDEDAGASKGSASSGSRVLSNGNDNPEYLPNNPSVRRSEITSISFFDDLGRVPHSGVWDASLDRDGSVVAWIEHNGSDVELMFAADGGVRGGESCSSTFYGYSNLRSIFFNGCFDTTGTRYMDNMFAWCTSLTEIDITGLDTSQVCDMSFMFYNCSSLEAVTAEDIDTRNVLDMQAMFMDCTSLISLRLGEGFVVDCRAPAMLDGTQFEGMDLF